MEEDIRKADGAQEKCAGAELAVVETDAAAVNAPVIKNDMRKRIWILVALLLCVGALITLVVLRSGIPIVDFWTVAGNREVEDTRLSSMEKLEELGGTRVRAAGMLVLYEKTDADGVKTQYVFNIASKKTVATLVDTESLKHTVALSLAEQAPWFSVETQTGEGDEARFSLSLCDASGASFAKKEGLTGLERENLVFDASVLDLILLDREVFRPEKNGSFKRAFSLETFASLPAFDKKVGDYYFIEDGETFHIYDKSARLTATYRVPAAAKSFRHFYLADGTLLFQYATVEDAHSQDYTYIENGQKYTLHHLLVSAYDGKKTVLTDIPMFISTVLSDDEVFRALGMNANIDNLAIGYPVQDGVLEENTHYVFSVMLSNRGRVTSVVGDIIPAMQGGLIFGVAKNRWAVTNLAGEVYLLNEWGGVVGHFPKNFMSSVESAAKIFVHDEKIYDWDLKLLYDMKENGVLSHEMVGTSVLMHKANGEALLYDGQARNVISLASPESGKTVSVRGGILIAVQETVEGVSVYGIYNECGEGLGDVVADTVEVYHYGVEGKAVVELIATKGETVEIYLLETEK